MNDDKSFVCVCFCENRVPVMTRCVILSNMSVSLEIKHDLQTNEQMICTMKYIKMLHVFVKKIHFDLVCNKHLLQCVLHEFCVALLGR